MYGDQADAGRGATVSHGIVVVLYTFLNSTMKVYTCTNCHNPLYFENSKCLHCGHAVGFDPAGLTMITLPGSYKYCKNAEYGVCNWLIPAASDSSFCLACTLNRVIPSLNSNENRRLWKNMEVAKHRLIYSLLRLKLPFTYTRNGQEEALLFDFMADGSTKVMTGHDNGVI